MDHNLTETAKLPILSTKSQSNHGANFIARWCTCLSLPYSGPRLDRNILRPARRTSIFTHTQRPIFSCVFSSFIKRLATRKKAKKNPRKKKKKWFTDEIQLSLAETLGSMSETTERNGILAFSVFFYSKVKFLRCSVGCEAKKLVILAVPQLDFWNFEVWKLTNFEIPVKNPVKKLFVWTFQGFIEIGTTTSSSRSSVNERDVPLQGIFDIDRLPMKN